MKSYCEYDQYGLVNSLRGLVVGDVIRVAENRGARERRSYEVSNLVRSVSQYQK